MKKSLELIGYHLYFHFIRFFFRILEVSSAHKVSMRIQSNTFFGDQKSFGYSLRVLFLLFFFGFFIIPVRAQLEIDITGIGSNLYPISVAPFVGEGADSHSINISKIIHNDLARSSRFNLLKLTTAIAETKNLDFAQWKLRGINALVVGSIVAAAQNEYLVRFRLFDIARSQDLGGLSFSVPHSQLRLVAHKIADYIYEKILGIQGAFSTRFLFVERKGKLYRLRIADSDGENAHIALSSEHPIISPTWSPDGLKVAYVSFENSKPVIYIHDLSTGQRSVAADFKGSNSAPRWSPEGNHMALALSRDGHTQIYQLDLLHNRSLHRLSKSDFIDTEPFYTPDGKSIYFTSDRGGSPQIYKMPVSGETLEHPAQRITFQGSYHTSPRISRDGKWLAYIKRDQGKFKVQLQELTTGKVFYTSQTEFDESPSFSANSQMLLYATQMGAKQVLVMVDVNTYTHQTLSLPEVNVREPAWGPFQ